MPNKQPIDLPTRQSVEKLFKLLREEHYKRQDAKFNEADKELDALEDAFKDSKEYKSAKKKREAASDEFSKKSNALKHKRDDVYRKYLACGLTDEVRAEIEVLLKEYEEGQ